MDETKTLKINDTEYAIKQLGGSYKYILSSRRNKIYGDLASRYPQFIGKDSKDVVNDEAFKVAYSSLVSEERGTEEYIEFVKKIVIKSVIDPQLDSETFEKHFEKRWANIDTLMSAIISYNLDEAEEKKTSATESSKT